MMSWLTGGRLQSGPVQASDGLVSISRATSPPILCATMLIAPVECPKSACNSLANSRAESWMGWSLG